jgi:putative PIG3 family NAD(P)H quinone oxidoreductase
VRALTIADGRLLLAERPIPDPEPDGVVVRVYGAGLNRADLLQRAGGYPAPPGAPADVPGVEFAGRVHTVGANVRNPQIGERVFGLVGGGAQAEYVAVPARHCAPVSETLDLVAMGGVPEAFITAHDALLTQARLEAGEWMLVHAVGSGVGTAAVQIAKALGANVVGTARTAEKLDRCRVLGLDVGIVPPEASDGTLDVDALVLSIIEATKGGADVTLDLAGGNYFVVDVSASAVRGRIVLVGLVAGTSAIAPLAAIMGKRLMIMGTMLRSRDVREKAGATDAFARDVVPLLESGTLAPVVDTTLPLDRADDAYEHLASNTTFGKVILDCR